MLAHRGQGLVNEIAGLGEAGRHTEGVVVSNVLLGGPCDPVVVLRYTDPVLEEVRGHAIFQGRPSQELKLARGLEVGPTKAVQVLLGGPGSEEPRPVGVRAVSVREEVTGAGGEGDAGAELGLDIPLRG